MNNKHYIDDLFNAFKNTSDYKDSCMMEIVAKKKEYEDNLDAMYDNYKKGCTRQIVSYNEQINNIKKCGLKVFRNSKGKHKIVIPK